MEQKYLKKTFELDDTESFLQRKLCCHVPTWLYKAIFDNYFELHAWAFKRDLGIQHKGVPAATT